MLEYIKAQAKTNDTIISNHFSSDELTRFSKSDYRWAANRTKPFKSLKIKKGEIYQFDFGKNYPPEMSYEHRGLVIGVKQRLLYVLPIFTYLPSKHPNVYHPIDSPNSKSDYFLLKSCDYPFITHDSVLKLNDIRTISVNRLLYQHTGTISPSSDTYKIIENLVQHKYFPDLMFQLNQLKQDLSTFNTLISEKEHTIELLSYENEQIKQQLTSNS